jgi:hypothetical protein
MGTLPMEEKRNKVLLALYQSTMSSPRVDVEKLHELAGIELMEFHNILRQLGSGKSGEGLLKKAGMQYEITATGRQKAEEIIKMQMAEKVRMVLRKIYDMGGESHMKFVDIPDLQRELGMSQDELFSIINWAEKNTNWFDDNMDQAVRLSPDGVQEVELPSSERRGGGYTYNTNFHAPVQGGIQVGGSHNVQKNVYNNDPKVDEAADALIKLIQASGIGELDKEDFVNHAERLKELGAKEKTTEVAERAKKNLEAIETGLKVTEKSGELALKAAPHLATIWQAFVAWYSQ